MRKTIQKILAVAAAGSAIAVAAQANAQQYRLEIDRTQLRTALGEFALQTGLSVSFLAKNSEEGDVLVGPLSGRYAIESALDQLVAGSGLVYSRVNATTIVITPRVAPLTLAQLNPEGQATPARSSTNARLPNERRVLRGDVEEVIVTARKREEALQDVPMSVDVVSGIELSNLGVSDANGLFGRVPNVYFTSAGGNGPSSDYYYLVIRGIGFNGGQEAAVGVFVDGMYQPSLGYDISFLDLERLEVLRGPQGTLFGRNTEGGAVNLVTKKPDENLDGRVEAEGASFGTYRALAAVSGPIADNLFGGVSAEYVTSDGFIDNVTTGTDHDSYDRTSARATLRWTPTDAVEFILTADLSQKDFNDPGYSQPLERPCCQALDEKPVEDSKDNKGLTLTFDWDLSDAITLTSISGVRVSESDITWDLDGVASGLQPATVGPFEGPTLPLAQSTTTVAGSDFFNEFEQTYYSQELRLSGSGQVANWLLGAYYFGQEQDEAYTVKLGPGFVGPAIADFLPLLAEHYNDLDRDGYALFGQASWKVAERFELTAGGRYSSEEVSIQTEKYDYFGGIDFLSGPELRDERTDFTDFSPLGSVSYRWNDDVLTYFTVSKGWKAGGFDRLGNVPLWNIPFKSEESTNWELGLKSVGWDNRLSANVSLFYIDIEDQQLVVTVQDPETGLFDGAIDNAGSSRSYGAELDMQAHLTERLTVSVAAGYTETEIEEYVNSLGVDFAGSPFPFVPEWTGAVNVDYTLPVSNELALNFHVDYNFVDDYTQLRDQLGNLYLIPSYDRTNLHVSLSNESAKWQVIGYVYNVFDSFDYTSRADSAFARDSEFAQEFKTGVLAPRQYGIKLTKRF